MHTPPDSARPTALITGLRGFTGQYLARSLRASGYQVVGLDIDDLSGADAGLAPEHSGLASPAALAAQQRVDLTDHAAVAERVAALKPTLVAHLAAQAFVAHDNPDSFYHVNLLGTRHLLDALAALSHHPRCVLLASSANIYGNALMRPDTLSGTHPVILTEDTPPHPANDYAVSKLAMEYLAQLWQDRLPIVVARPFNYTGVGQSLRFVIPKIVDHFRRGARSIELGNLDVARDFSDVRSVAAAYHHLLEHAPAGTLVNICSGQAIALQQVLAWMADIAGYAIDVEVNPAFVRANEIRELRGSRDRLTQLTGAIPWIPLPETLRWMYASKV